MIHMLDSLNSTSMEIHIICIEKEYIGGGKCWHIGEASFWDDSINPVL